jgi:hypothetical protein
MACTLMRVNSRMLVGKIFPSPKTGMSMSRLSAGVNTSEYDCSIASRDYAKRCGALCLRLNDYRRGLELIHPRLVGVVQRPKGLGPRFGQIHIRADDRFAVRAPPQGPFAAASCPKPSWFAPPQDGPVRACRRTRVPRRRRDALKN